MWDAGLRTPPRGDTLNAVAGQARAVLVTVSVAGEEAREVDASGATYGDLVRAVGLSPQEAVALVDGRPVPEDQPVEAGRAKVLRLVAGG